MEYRFNVKSSSSDENYIVSFKFDNLITVNCTCQAALNKMLCKHRLNLIDGDVTSLANHSEISALQGVLDKIDKNKIAALYTDLNAIESEIKALEATRKKLRKEIGFKFSTGF